MDNKTNNTKTEIKKNDISKLLKLLKENWFLKIK